MKIYMIGIKGSGMAGLAQILCDLGNEVRGADVIDDLYTNKGLIEKNIVIDSLNNMNYHDSDIIIVGNSFINKYIFIDKKVINYQEALAELCNRFYSIAVCGTHGKTTITNMIKHVLSFKYPISYLVGDGQGKGNIKSNFFIFEACEHREHFLKYTPNIIVCSNIDYDHVDYYKNKRTYKKAFINFFKQAKDKLILHDSIKYNESICFGKKESTYQAKNIKYSNKGITFDLIAKDHYYKDLYLPFYGEHLLMDSLACISCCNQLGMNIQEIITLLSSYKMAQRRYNLSYFKNNVIVDDYGHHPLEIKSTINAIKQQFPNKKLIIIYHPDRPIRITTFIKEYNEVFALSEKTYVLPFICMDKVKQEALDILIDNKHIFMFSNEFYKHKYENYVFLFTGSKEMKNIIKKLSK